VIYQQAPPAPVYVPAPQMVYAPAPARPPTYVSPSYGGYHSSSTGLATAALTGMMVGAAMSGPRYGRGKYKHGGWKYKRGGMKYKRGKWKR
jgi:hypothetical protein